MSYFNQISFHQTSLYSRIKILVFIDLSVVGFYEYIGTYQEILVEILKKNIGERKFDKNL